MALPTLNVFRMSLFERGAYSPTETFVGLQNYIDVFARDDCFAALKLSLYYTLCRWRWRCCSRRF